MEPVVVVVCPDCGVTYVPDNPDDIERHSKIHEEVTAPDRPKSDPRIAKLADPVSGVLVFERSDPDFLHKKLYGISCRFKREMKYDQSGWAPVGYQVAPGAIGAMFSDQDGRTLGGAGIYTQHTYRNVSHLIGWIWIAPDYRRKGVFARALPELAMRYPGALLEFPYSDALKRFAQGSSYICNKGGPLYLKR